MRRSAALIRWCAAVLLLLGWTTAACAQEAIPPLSGPVVDLTGTLSAADKAALEQRLRAFTARRGSQIQVLMVPTTGVEDIAQFGIRVADAWKIGRATQDGQRLDDGVILIIAKNDRRMRIEVGYGLEGAIPDAIAARIIEDYLRPAFRAGDFAGGIAKGVDALISRIEGETLPPPDPGWQTDTGEPPGLIFAVFIGFFIGSLAGPILRALAGRGVGATLTGAGAGVVAGTVLTSIVAGALGGFIGFIIALMAGMSGRGGGGWYHGPSGGGWSSGGGGGWSSGGGGWSGGGGGFGGGGASGGW